MGKFNIGDSVWFSFDNGKKEQKGVIQNVIHYMTFEDDYLIRGNVDKKLYSKRESELITIAPHKRWLEIKDNEKRCSNCRHYSKSICEDPCYHCDTDSHTKWEPDVKDVDYKSFYPDWEAQAKAIKQLEVRANDAADPYRYIYDYFKNNSSWGIAAPIKLFGDMPENNSVIKLDFDVDILKEDKPMNKKMVIKAEKYEREIKDIIFSGPATIVKFENKFFDKKEKTVVKCSEEDGFDKTKGFLLALIKEFVDKKSYNNILRIIDGFEEPEAEMTTAKDVWDSLPQNLKDDIIEQEALKAINKSNLEEPVEISEVEPWMQISKIPSVLAASLKHYKILENKSGLYDIYTPNSIIDGGFKSESQHRYHVGHTLHLFEKMVLSDIPTDRDELRAVLQHLIICIDADKYHLDWKRSEKDLRIRDIDNKYKHIAYIDCVKKYLDSIN